MKNLVTVFVLSLFDTGLAAVRSLGRAGVPVIGLDFDPEMSGFKSRYGNCKLSPDPVHQSEALVELLIAEGRRQERPGIIIPASDAYVLFLSSYRDELAPYFRFILPPAPVLEAIINKRRQYELAEQVGTPIARTFYPETMADVVEIKDDLDYPAFIKPYIGHLWREQFGGAHKGFKVYSSDELVARYEEIFPKGLQAMVQSIILGPNTNHFKVNAYIGLSGEPLALFTLRKIRQYPTEFGVGTCVESLLYPELIELGMQFFRGINYRGIGSIEFKRDERDGKLKMIELNPRLWQQNILATDCGMNFPLIEYMDLTGRPLEPSRNFKVGVKWLDIMADFQSFWAYHKRGELSLKDWINSWKGAKSFPTFAWDDLGPFFKSYEYGRKLFRIPLYLIRQRKSSGQSLE
jgi:predicted ATP-grasp superfamily ATP-dependent carboligase